MGTYAPATPSTWTKGALCDSAFGEIGLAPYVFDLTAEQKAAALKKLTGMMRGWEGRGCDLAYDFPDAVDGDAYADASGIPDETVEAVYSNLALRLAPDYGKTPTSDTRRAAFQGWRLIQAKCAVVTPQELPSTLAVGAGNQRWDGRVFFPVAAGETEDE